MDRNGILINRARELAALRELADTGRPVIALISGRRRVGKTYLLSHAWPDRRVFYYLATDSTGTLNRLELLNELSAQFGLDLDPADFPTWRTVFRRFVDLADDGPLAVVLDEFQYLLNRADDVVSQLVAVWDREVRGRPLLLALCGSEVATMEALASGSQPLYGRIGWRTRLQPFDYWDAAELIDRPSVREAAILYGVFGGTPRYLAAARGGGPLPEVIRRLMLEPEGEVHLQVEQIVEQEKGIRDPAGYRAILAALGAGRTTLQEIAAATGLDQQDDVRRRLAILIDLGLVRRERNFGAHRTAPFRYRIADHAVRFWYRFIHPNRSLIATGEVEEAWRRQIAPHLNDYMGHVFEDIVREAFPRCRERWGLPAATDWGRWEGQDRNRRSIEVDIVAELADGRILTGEVKWREGRPVDTDVHHDLLRDLDDLARSGVEWARRAAQPEQSAGHLYVASAGFTPHFRALAATNPRIHLATLDDLYPPPPESGARPEP